MKQQIKITYLKKAYKFLAKNQNKISEEIVDDLLIKAIKKLFFNQDTNIDLKALKGDLLGKYRIRKNSIRIIFSIYEEEVIIEAIVENIDFRGNIY